MWMLIWYNIARRRAQAVLTIVITFLTIMSFVLVLGIFQVMKTGIRLSQDRLGADVLLVPQEATVDDRELLFSAIPENIYMDSDILMDVAEFDGIAAMSPQFYSQTLDSSCCDTGREIRIIGFDQDTDFILKPYLAQSESGRLEEDQIILGGNFGDFVGQRYVVLANRFDVVGQLYPTGTGMDDIIFMDIDTARRISYESDALKELWTERDPDQSISAIMIKLEAGVDPAVFAQQVAESGMEVQCVLTSDTVSSLQEQLDVTMTVLLVLWCVSLIIAALALYGRFSSLAKDRKKEIGLLRAIGVKKGKIFVLVIGEACTMAVIGGCLGSAMALLCIDPVIKALRDVFSLSPSVWSLPLALTCGAAGLGLACLLGFIAALLPAIRSASLDPQTAIVQGEIN